MFAAFFCRSHQGNCFAQPFDDEQGGECGDDDDEDEDDDMVDGNVAYASCDLVGAYAKVGGVGLAGESIAWLFSVRFFVLCVGWLVD